MATLGRSGTNAGLRSDHHSTPSEGIPLRCGYGTRPHGSEQTTPLVLPAGAYGSQARAGTPVVHSAVERPIADVRQSWELIPGLPLAAVDQVPGRARNGRQAACPARPGPQAPARGEAAFKSQ